MSHYIPSAVRQCFQECNEVENMEREGGGGGDKVDLVCVRMCLVERFFKYMHQARPSGCFVYLCNSSHVTTMIYVTEYSNILSVRCGL